MNLTLQNPTARKRMACPAARLDAAVERAREARGAYLAERLCALRNGTKAAVERVMLVLHRRKPEFRQPERSCP